MLSICSFNVSCYITYQESDGLIPVPWFVSCTTLSCHLALHCRISTAPSQAKNRENVPVRQSPGVSGVISRSETEIPKTLAFYKSGGSVKVSNNCPTF